MWHLVMLPDDEDPIHLRFASFEAMLEAISSAESLACYAIFPFFGVLCPLHRSVGDLALHYLRHPFGEMHALFSTQPSIVEVADGRFNEQEIDVTVRPSGSLGYMPEETEEREAGVRGEDFVDEPDSDPEDPDDVTDAISPADGAPEFP